MLENYQNKLKELYKFSDIDLLRYFKNHPESLAFFPLAKRLFKKNKFKELIYILNNGIENYNDFTEAYILLAKAYLKLNLEIEAIKILKKIISVNPNVASPYYYLSNILYSQNLRDKADVLLLKAYELEPSDPDIKNSFQKNIKKSMGLTETINIENTVAESLNNIKKNDKDQNKKLDTINKYENASEVELFDELEREFSNNYKKIYYTIFFIIFILIISFIAYLVFNMSRKNKEEAYLNNNIELLNNNLSMKTINKMKNDNVSSSFDDTIEFYEVLYHYQKDNTKYLNSVENTKKRTKNENIWQNLSKMTYYMYEQKKKFNDIYNKVSRNPKYNSNPYIFMLKALDLIAKKDILNATSILNTAYIKSNKSERFKVELSYIYLLQDKIDKIRELFIDSVPLSKEGDMFLEISSKDEKNKYGIIEKYIQIIPQRLIKRRLQFHLIKLYKNDKNLAEAEEKIKKLNKTKIPYYDNL